MGVVYMAEQTQPVSRRVALRSSSRAWTRSEVLARFEAERQALALMDHPNIARVLDAGTTDAGRPYFVMELVKGVPITSLLRREAALAQRAAGAVHSGLPGRAARPPERDHSPRPQALEHPGRAVRQPAGAQGHRLRPGQGDRPEADRADDVHAVRPDRRHDRLHEPRAGVVQPARRRHAERHLLAGRAALRAARRRDAVRQEAAALGGLRRNAADHPPRGAATAQRPAEQPRVAARHRRQSPASSPRNSACSFAANSTGSS